MNVMKTGSSSTLEIISGIKDKMEIMKSKGMLPAELKLNYLSDQSIFVVVQSAASCARRLLRRV